MNEFDVFVAGSANVDQTITVERMPEEGETLKGLDFQLCCGGKGANQAVAAARAKAKTAFLGCVGKDKNARMIEEKFLAEAIDCRFLRKVDTPTGIALIQLTTKGENAITIYEGANGCISLDQIEQSSPSINNSSVVLLQNEVPEEVNLEIARRIVNEDVKLVLNPAPARQMNSSLLKKVDCLIPNQTETRLITGIKITDEKSLCQAADKVHNMGISEVIITLGKDGCFVSDGSTQRLLPAEETKVVNTIGAGDCFCGVFCSLIAKGLDCFEAVKYANKASSIAVSKQGAMDSMPTLEQYCQENLSENR